jgi:hypothetical protein
MDWESQDEFSDVDTIDDYQEMMRNEELKP